MADVLCSFFKLLRVGNAHSSSFVFVLLRHWVSWLLLQEGPIA
jgi:hypothetical protein